MGTSTIEWTERTWNPVIGCTKISPECAHCYAETRAILSYHQGIEHPSRLPEYMNCVDENGWTGKIELCHHRLNEPDNWPPCRIFVPSMSDLFHPGVPFDYIDQVIATIVRNQQHNFQLLTKRPDRQLEYWRTLQDYGFMRILQLAGIRADEIWKYFKNPWVDPIPNLWMGCTIGTNRSAFDRLQHFLKIPAAISFYSMEPLLEQVKAQLRPDGENCLICGDIGHQLIECHHTSRRTPDWIIVGGENGPKARPMHPDWVRYQRDQAADAVKAFFFKGWGQWSPSPKTNRAFKFDDGQVMYRQRSRKIAGRILDGRTHDQYPI